MTQEQFQYLNKLRKALKEIVDYSGQVEHDSIAYYFQMVAKEALENTDEN
jgi:hypothetical protein